MAFMFSAVTVSAIALSLSAALRHGDMTHGGFDSDAGGNTLQLLGIAVMQLVLIARWAGPSWMSRRDDRPRWRVDVIAQERSDERHRRQRVLRTTCVAILPWFLFTPAVAGARAPALPVLEHVRLKARVDVSEETIGAQVVLRLRNDSPQPISRLPLLLNRLLRVTAVESEGVALSFRQVVAAFEAYPRWQVNAVDVDVPRPLLPGESRDIRVTYGGYLAGYTEVGMQYVQDRIGPEFTLLREDALAFPLPGTLLPDPGKSGPRLPFDYDVEVTVPEGLVAATGGIRMESRTENGWTTWRFRSRSPAPYLVVAVAPYRLSEADGITIYHFAEDEAGARQLLEASQKALARLARIFGPLADEPTLSIMEIPEGWGSQASLAGGIIQEAGAFRAADKRAELYHELSHLWSITERERPPSRWSEGLAMFLQDRLAWEIDGRQDATQAWQRTAERLREQCTAESPCQRVPLREFGRQGNTGDAYLVGRLLFAVLYTRLGEKHFDAALKDMYRRHRAAGAHIEDLTASFVRYGDAEARAILDTWMNSTSWWQILQRGARIEDVLQDATEGKELDCGNPSAAASARNTMPARNWRRAAGRSECALPYPK